MLGAEQEADYYSILGVDRGAGPEMVRERYRRLMQQNHPDTGGDTRMAALINKAYAVLSNPESRAEYDSRLFILERVAEGLSMSEAVIRDMQGACLFCAQPHDYGPNDDLVDVSCEHCGSTLQRVEDQPEGSSGQRAVERLGRFMDITLFTQHPQRKGFAARTEDVSLRGLRISTGCNLNRGQRIRIVSNVFDAVGEVVHCVAGQGWRAQTIAGVAFLTLRFARPAGVFVSRKI